jgi:hypothetical protein
VDLRAAADELYALRPDGFVARRDELAAEAKQAGDRTLAADVKKLPRPSVAAWAVNMLLRHHPDQVEQVLDLGAALREAQESMAGDELRQLGRQRRQLTAAVTRQARSLASELGQKLGDAAVTQVEETLHAAMVDAEAARAIRTGLLAKPLAVTGTEAADVVESVAVRCALGKSAVRRASVGRRTGGKAADAGAARADEQSRPEPSHRPELSVVPDNSRAIKEAEAELAGAEQALADAERKLVKAGRKVEKRTAKGLQLRAELEELRRRAAELEERIEANEDELAEAEETRDEREAAVSGAQAGTDRARKALEGLR